jgi:hypothetical protein
MTVNKTVSGKDLAQLFAALGGWRGVARFARKNDRNRLEVYRIFGKALLETSGGGSIAAVEDDKQALSSVVEQALLGAIAARRGDRPYAPGGHVLDSVNSDVTNADQHGNRDSVADNVTPIDHGLRDAGHTAEVVTPKTPHAAQAPSPQKPRQLTAQEHRERALGPSNPPINEQSQPSATDLFYSRNGSARAQWSPPRNW